MFKHITKGKITTVIGIVLIGFGIYLQILDLKSVYALIWESIGILLLLSPDELIKALIYKISGKTEKQLNEGSKENENEDSNNKQG